LNIFFSFIFSYPVSKGTNSVSSPYQLCSKFGSIDTEMVRTWYVLGAGLTRFGLVSIVGKKVRLV